MNKLLWGVVGAAMLAVTMAVAEGDASSGQQPKPNKVGDFMRLKLDHAQKVLEGLAKEDFEAVSVNAQKISLLTQDENWQVLQTVDYRRHSDDFRRTANALAEAARKKNIDGATLAYVQLTMQCMYCHKHVRREQAGK